MNMLWIKGPKADFEILVCLHEIDVICKVHTQLVFSIEQEEIHALALYNGTLFFIFREMIIS